MNSTFWIILTACLTGATCGPVGCFLVLRRMVMMSDAISHSVLPGIVIGFLLTGSRVPLVMLSGAVVFGLLTAWLTELVNKTGDVESGASMGVVFTLLFALGVILMSAYTGQIDLDADCVLYGEIAYVGWDSFFIGGHSLGPRAVWMLGASLIINVLFITLFYKQLKLCAFDPEMARSLGVRTGIYHYLLMTATALTTVAAFESVGAILVVAMLVVPASTAFLLTQRLVSMLFLSATVGCLSALLGYAFAQAFDTSISGAMTVTAGLLFVLAFLFSPHHGVLIRRWRGIDTSSVPDT